MLPLERIFNNPVAFDYFLPQSTIFNTNSAFANSLFKRTAASVFLLNTIIPQFIPKAV